MKLLPPKYRIKFYQEGPTGYFKIQQRFMLLFYSDDISIWADSKDCYMGYKFSYPPEELLEQLLKYG